MLIKYTLIILVIVIPTACLAKTDCESIAGEVIGEAKYVYETAEVKTLSHSHFYSAPAAKCQLPAFLINGNKVEILRKSQEYKFSGEVSKDYLFSYVRYRDKNGAFVMGWIMANNLIASQKNLIASSACQQWANQYMRNRESKAPSSKNHYKIIGRAWFYTIPNEQCSSSFTFLIPGDIVSIQEQSKDDFIEAVYYTANQNIVHGWLKKSQLQPLNTGDHYRTDINPLSTDKAMQIVTLNLRTDYQCFFYESWNEVDDIKMIVREDHNTKFCRGTADPEISPAIDNISINKFNGKITREFEVNK